MSKVLIIGGGASGMAAAYAASLSGHEAVILEQNEKLGKKLFITGKGRCNVTNAAEMSELLNKIITNRKFVYSAMYSFTNEDVMSLLPLYGCPLKVERGGRVFPESDHSSDVISAWKRILESMGVDVCLRVKVLSICVKDGKVTGVKVLKDGKEQVISADAVIVCTGGCSYKATGSTGDGYRFAREAGIEVTKLSPALVPLTCREAWVRELMGLSLRNIQIRVSSKNGKSLYEDFGEMLFTHFGVSGPVILSASSFVTSALRQGEQMELSIDLKPALTEEQLDHRILQDFSREMNKQFKNALNGLLPSKIIPVVVFRSGIPEDKAVNEVTREERRQLVSLLKSFTLTIDGTGSFDEAIITQGGIDVKEINPKTMESKKVKGLYFAGEVLDVDGHTGGYNLQIAWSTGYAAGSHIE